MACLGVACMDPVGTVGSIYKGEYYTLVHTAYEIFLCFSNCKSKGAIDPRGGAISDPRGKLGRIHVKLHIAMLHTKYRSFGCLMNFHEFSIDR